MCPFPSDFLQLVVDDAPVSPPTPQSIIYSVLPFPKQRAELNELSCDCFTFLTPSGPVDQKEKEGDSVEEAQTSASKVTTRLRPTIQNTLAHDGPAQPETLTQICVALETVASSPFSILHPPTIHLSIHPSILSLIYLQISSLRVFGVLFMFFFKNETIIK